MDLTLIILAAGLTLLGLALVLLAVFLKRGRAAEAEMGAADKRPKGDASQTPDAFIDQPLETDMSAVLLGAAPFSATGTSPAVELTVDREAQPSDLDEAGEDTLEEVPSGRSEEQPEVLVAPVEWEDADVAEVIDLELPGELEPTPERGELIPRTPEVDHFSWHLRRDAPVLGAAAGIALAASLIGYALGRRGRKC